MPTVDVPVVTLARVCHMKKNRNGIFVRREADALVWDPTVVRAILDAKPGRQPMVAMLARRGGE
jgi:hypothetical protein